MTYKPFFIGVLGLPCSFTTRDNPSNLVSPLAAPSLSLCFRLTKRLRLLIVTKANSSTYIKSLLMKIFHFRRGTMQIVFEELPIMHLLSF